MQEIEIIPTADGSSTLRSTQFQGQLYHSERGAIGEARHVFLRFLRPDVRVLEVGLGSGLNALLTMQSGAKVDYTAVELYPVPLDVVTGLSFACPDLMAIHSAPWGERVALSPTFSIRKIEGDMVKLTQEEICLNGAIDLVFFDAFAPEVVPQMWSEELFATLYASMAPGGQLLTYSAKGSVRRTLQEVGFQVERLEGALGKRHMVRAFKCC
ncbi:MAG: tRNA (5-methylaminomethyl-2-thiouridine)(34)-methyltransferase MnmD [Mucinivorans sp.]